MSDKTELLIENVRKHRCLYDSADENYKNILIKAELWNTIARELNTTSEAVKTKWKNLRDSYMRFKRTTKGETGQTKKYAKWPWSVHLSFLDASLQYRVQSSNVGVREVGDESFPSVEPTSPLTTYEEMHPPPPAKKKKMSLAETSQSDVDKILGLSEKKNLDSVDLLFMSFAATFKTIQPRTQALLKLKLSTLFAETEVNELQEPEKVSKPQQRLLQNAQTAASLVDTDLVFDDTDPLNYPADSPSPSHASTDWPENDRLSRRETQKRERDQEEEEEEELLGYLKHRIKALRRKPSHPPSTSHHIAFHWADKLAGLKGEQRIFAEKLINDTIYEAEFGRLNHGCHIVPSAPNSEES